MRAYAEDGAEFVRRVCNDNSTGRGASLLHKDVCSTLHSTALLCSALIYSSLLRAFTLKSRHNFDSRFLLPILAFVLTYLPVCTLVCLSTSMTFYMTRIVLTTLTFNYSSSRHYTPLHSTTLHYTTLQCCRRRVLSRSA